MVANPFFLFKNRPSESYGPYSSAFFYVKSGSPDPADFAMTWHLIHWRVLELRAMVGATVGISLTITVQNANRLEARL
jgi:hypothetical protein